MACRKCGAPCHGRHCQLHRIEAAHEGVIETEGTRMTLKAQREALEDDASQKKAKPAGDSGGSDR